MATAKKEKVIVDESRETTWNFWLLGWSAVTGLFIITFVLQAFEIPSSRWRTRCSSGPCIREPGAVRSADALDGPLMPYRDIRRNDIVVFVTEEQVCLW